MDFLSGFSEMDPAKTELLGFTGKGFMKLYE